MPEKASNVNKRVFLATDLLTIGGRRAAQEISRFLRLMNKSGCPIKHLQ